MASDLDWIILRPSVVVGRPAYGGSALFRGLASLPVLPVMPNTGLLQVVQLDDVADTVLFFLAPGAPTRLALDLAGPEQLPVTEVVRSSVGVNRGLSASRLGSQVPSIVSATSRDALETRCRPGASSRLPWHGARSLRRLCHGRPQLSRRRHHVGERRPNLVPFPGLEPAIRVHPDLVGLQMLRGFDEELGHLLHRGHARRMDVVDARSDLVRILK